MNTNKPQIYSAGGAIRSIQGQSDVPILAEKTSVHPDANPMLHGFSQATVNAYQADE
jgi:hypothetical protein